MKIWKNTSTLDGYDEGLIFTVDKLKAEILLLGSKPINLDEFPKAMGIFRAGIGKDNVPVKEAEKKGILVKFPSNETVGLIYEETASFTCSLIFRMNYETPGTLNPWVKFDRIQMRDKTLLVIGKGNIGALVAEKMNPFLKVITYDIKDNPVDDIEGLIPEADFITLHIPSTPENQSFFNKRKLALIKNGAVLINTARGAIVNEQALYDELSEGRIKAAFDVFWQEPYEGKLLEFYPDKFYMTPHVASTCVGFLKGCSYDLRRLIKEITND